jgi:hypothetical protein
MREHPRATGAAGVPGPTEAPTGTFDTAEPPARPYNVESPAPAPAGARPAPPLAARTYGQSAEQLRVAAQREAVARRAERAAAAGDPSDATETLLLFRDDLAREIERRERLEAKLARPRGIRKLIPYLPLLPILAVQAVLALRLMGGRTASVEEAADLFAGHMEIGHVLHGASISNYPTFFSGAPVLYPVLDALLDTAHGLFAARCLSLVCMLLATTAVFKVGRRLYGLPAGIAAAAVFSVLGPTLHLSSYATFDGLALCLLAWAVYHTVSFAYGDSRNALIYAVSLMVLADCVKYAVLLWNPVLIALVAVAGPGWKAWKVSRAWNVQRFALLSACVLGVVVLTGREPYFTGLTRTVKLTVDSNLLRGDVLSDVTSWLGVLLVLAFGGFLGLLRAARGDRATKTPRAGTAALFLLGGLIAPLYQLALNTNLSLDKQSDIGAVFAAVPAGWLIARAAETARQPRTLTAALASVLALAIAVPMGISGVTQGTAMANAWPNAAEMVSVLQPLVHRGTQNYLVEDAAVAEYYIGGKKVAWTQWHDTTSCVWSQAGTTVTGATACKDAIAADYYSVIVLDYAETPKTDAAISPTISTAGYRLKGSYSVPTSVGPRTYSVWALVTGS